jgi:hypothetical protein
MADVTIFRDPTAVNVVVIDGVPPVDQTATVQALTTQLATANSTITQLNAAIAAARTAAQAIVARDAAIVEGQAVLDALPPA